MSDKPLDATGFPHQAGIVGKHDFQQSTVTKGYEIIHKRSGCKGIQCGKCNMRFDNGVAYGYYCPNLDCPLKI